jgi:hypothetical protein
MSMSNPRDALFLRLKSAEIKTFRRQLGGYYIALERQPKSTGY